MSKKEVPFEVLVGKRILISLPNVEEQTDGGIILTPEMQKDKQMSDVEKTMKMEVLMVGTDCDYKTILKPGDFVFVQQRAIQPGIAELIIKDGKAKWLVIPDREIVGIY